MKKIALIICLTGTLLFNFGIVPSNAAEVDVLINKLVEKVILSQQEAGQLLKEMQKEGASLRGPPPPPRGQDRPGACRNKREDIALL